MLGWIYIRCYQPVFLGLVSEPFEAGVPTVSVLLEKL